jgi:hypothetical protein
MIQINDFYKTHHLINNSLLLSTVTRDNETMQKKCRMVTTEYNSMKENYQQKVTEYKKLQKGKNNSHLLKIVSIKRRVKIYSV